MARFCGNCGAPLDDDALVCGQCGTPIDGLPINGAGRGKGNNTKKPGIKIKIIVIFLIITAVAITAIRTYLSFTGIQGMIKKVMKAYKKYDIETLISLSSDMYYYSGYDNYVEDYFSNAIGQSIDRFEESVGHSYKLEYEVVESYKVSQRKLDEMLSSIKNSFPDFDVENIKQINITDVKIKATQGDKTLSDKLKITLSQEGDSWKLLYIE